MSLTNSTERKMEITYQHGTEVYVVRASCNDDATDLVAIGGEHSVEVLQVVCCSQFAIFDYTVVEYLIPDIINMRIIGFISYRI